MELNILFANASRLDKLPGDGLYLLEVDRVLRPGGYFVWTSPLTNARIKENQKRWNFIRDLSVNLCWELLNQQDETVVWKKTNKRGCYYARKPGALPPICSKGNDAESSYYRPLQNCIGGTRSRRWIAIGDRPTWPSSTKLNANDLQLLGDLLAFYMTGVKHFHHILGHMTWFMQMVFSRLELERIEDSSAKNLS